MYNAHTYTGVSHIHAFVRSVITRARERGRARKREREREQEREQGRHREVGKFEKSHGDLPSVGIKV